MTFAITINRKYSGFYFFHGKIATRVGVGFIAFDVIYESLDVMMNTLMDKVDELQSKINNIDNHL